MTNMFSLAMGTCQLARKATAHSSGNAVYQPLSELRNFRVADYPLGAK